MWNIFTSWIEWKKSRNESNVILILKICWFWTLNWTHYMIKMVFHSSGNCCHCATIVTAFEYVALDLCTAVWRHFHRTPHQAINLKYIICSVCTSRIGISHSMASSLSKSGSIRLFLFSFHFHLTVQWKHIFE